MLPGSPGTPKTAAPALPAEQLTPAVEQLPEPPPRPRKPLPTQADGDDAVADLESGWPEDGDEDATAAGARRVKRALAVLADDKVTAKTRAAVAEALATILCGDTEASRGCLQLNGEQAGVDLLPGGAGLAFLRRAQRARGYTVLCWVRESEGCQRFTAAKLGSCHVLIEPITENGSLEWRAEVSVDGRRKTCGSRAVDHSGDKADDDDGAGHANETEALAPRWRMVAVSHAQKYLSPAEIQVSVDGLAVGGPVAAQLPTADASSKISVLDGFDGCAASIALLEGAASLKALRGAFWRGPRGGPGAASGAFRRGEHHDEEDDEDDTVASLAKLRVACALEPGRAGAGAWAPRGGGGASGRGVDVALGGSKPTRVILRNATRERGAAARCRDAVVSNGGCAAIVAACAEGGESSLLNVVAACLRRCGAAHAERVLEEQVFALLASKVSQGECAAQAWASLDAVAYALGAGSQLHARALGDLWASQTWARDRSEDRRVAWLEQAAMRCSAAAKAPPRRRRSARLFASALRRGVGVERLFRVARSLLRDVDDPGKKARGAAAARHLATACLVDEMRRPGKDSDGLDGARACCRCVHDLDGDADGSVRGAFVAALGRALSGADENVRRRCAEGLRSVRFAETTALAIVCDEARTKPLLRKAVLGLALWQHAWVSRHLAKLVESTRQEDKGANDSDDEDPLGSARRLSEVLRAQRDARRSAVRSAATLALAVGDALESNAWRASDAGIEDVLATLGVLDEKSWLAPPLWLALPLVAAVIASASGDVAARAVGAACARAKSTDLQQICSLEAWYAVGAFVKLSEAGHATVRLLALDALGHVAVRARALNPEGSHSTDGIELSAPVWRSFCRALQARSGPAHAPSIHDIAARAAFASVATACTRRLASECSKRPRDACQALASLLALCVETLWPPCYIRGEARQRNGEVLLFTDGLEQPRPRNDDARDAAAAKARALVDARDVHHLASAIVDASRTVRTAALEIAAPPTKEDGKGWYGAARLAARKIGEVADRSSLQKERDRKRDADACLLACRRCARTLGHALFWLNDGALADELRASVLTSIALADTNESETTSGLAVAARDDALHALVCLREWSRRGGDATPTTLQLIRDLYQRGNNLVRGGGSPVVQGKGNGSGPGGGSAAKRAADAVAPAINATDSEKCFALLAERLDEASRRDRDDAELSVASFEGEDGFAEVEHRWLAPDDQTTDLARRAASAFAHCALARATATRRRAAADARDGRRLHNDHREGRRKFADIGAVIGAAQSIEGQTNWSLSSHFGDGFRSTSRVAPREDKAVDLKAHDDPHEVAEQVRRAQAAHDSIMRKRLDGDLATALNAKRAAARVESDEDEDEAEKATPQKAPAVAHDDDDDEERDDVLVEVDDVARVTRQGLIRGRVVLTERSLKFRGRDGFEGRLNDVSAVLLRRYRLRDAGVEVYANGASLFLDCSAERLAPTTETFSDDDDSPPDEPGSPFGDRSSLGPPSQEQALKDAKRRDDLVRVLIKAVRTARARGGGQGECGPPGLFPLLQAPKSHPRRLLRRATRCWQERSLSNFDYLLLVNALAGRSFEDPCQYPVFPWVVQDYKSHTLYLDRPQTYRDLRKPMGAINEDRLRETVKRHDTFDDTYMPKFHYGSHYSTAAGVVVHYLVRCRPWAELHCDLQGGRFDVADRLFASVSDAWDANSGARGEKAGNEVKELTPEWYSSNAFLVNRGRLPLGAAQDGRVVSDVALPPWAEDSPAKFVAGLRAALEHPLTSLQLHAWLDLIFGRKQRGPLAVESANVFFYLCYGDEVDLDAIANPKLRAATVLQASHFGQCPLQLHSTKPWPSRGLGPGWSPLSLSAQIPDDPRRACLTPRAPLNESLAVARAAGLFHGFRGGPLLALRATAGRIVAVDGGGDICVLGWSDDAVEEDADEPRRRCSLRPLAAPDDLVKGPGSGEQAAERAACRGAAQLGVSSARLCSISADGALVASIDIDYAGGLRVTHVDLGDDGADAVDVRARPCGEASVVCFDCALTLVKCCDDNCGRVGVDPAQGAPPALDVAILIGAADGRAGVWRVDRASRPWPRRARLRRRADIVFRGHHAAVVAGALSRELGICVTNAADGRTLVHALRDGAVLRELAAGRPSTSPALFVGLSGPLALVALARPVGPSTLLDVHDVNGGCVAEVCVASAVCSAQVCGPLGDVLVVVAPSGVEVRALPSLVVTRRVDSKLFAPPGEAPTLSLLAFAPDPLAPCAVVVAFDDGLVALRVLAGSQNWAERRSQRATGVVAAASRRASQVMRFAAGVAARGNEVASAARDVVGEARAQRLPSFTTATKLVSGFMRGRSESTD